MTACMRFVLLLLCMASLLACESESGALTELVVEVDSDLRVPDELDRVTVGLEGAQASEASADLTKAPLPRTLGLVHSAGPLGPFVLHVTGWRKSQKVVETRVSASFQASKTVRVSVHLPSACAGVTCASDETCQDGACMTVNAGSDASMNDAGTSMGTQEAGTDDASTVSDGSAADTGTGAVCTIQQPVMGDTFQRSVAFNVQGSCKSSGGMAITQGLVWTSGLDGVVARAGSASLSLSSVGTHTLSLCLAPASGSPALSCVEVTVAVTAVAQPTASIISVVQGSTTRTPYQSAEPIVLTGVGSGAGATLSWSDSAQGALGTGPTVTLTAPSVGKHSVVLTVTDRSGRKSTSTSSFVVLAPGETTLLEPLGPSPALNAATDLAERSAGVVYVAAADGRVYALNTTTSDAPSVAVDKPPLQGTVQDVLLDPTNGLVYLATTGGLSVCRYAEAQGATDCATYTGGQLPSNNVRAVLRIPQSPAADKLLVGTEQGLLVADDVTGTSMGAVKINERAIRALVGDRNVVWVATDQGLYRYATSTNMAARINSASPSNASWNALQLGSAGAVWVGGSAGLARYNPSEDTWTSWRAADGLVGSTVSSIALESQQVDAMTHDILWIGTNGGVSRFDVQLGTFQSFTTADGLPSSSVTKVLVMSNGTKLFATDAGIVRYTGR